MTIEKYPTYKNSGVEWLGKIPVHWGIQKGKWMFAKQDRPVRKEDEIITCFRDGQVTLRTNRKTEGFTNALKEHGYQGIRKGDLVIHNMDAFAGAIGVSDSDGKATPVYSVCTPRRNYYVNPHYYAYFLRDLAKCGFIESLAKGIRERSTDFRFYDFGVLLLSVPPFAEQNHIVQFLDLKTAQIDKAIAQKERLIELLKERRQILIHKAVTRGLNPDVRMKDSEMEWIGEVPEHWEVQKVKYMFKQSKVPAERNDEIVTAFRDGEVTLRTNRRTEGFTIAILEQGYQKIRKGQLVLNSMDAFEGAIGVSDSDGKCTPEYVICDPIVEGLLPDYYAYLLREMALAKYIQVICNAVRERAIRIRFYNLSELFLPVPPLGEQNAIVEKVESIKVRINIAITSKEREIEKLKEYKVTLINAVVTGKIKVS